MHINPISKGNMPGGMSDKTQMIADINQLKELAETLKDIYEQFSVATDPQIISKLQNEINQIKDQMNNFINNLTKYKNSMQPDDQDLLTQTIDAFKIIANDLDNNISTLPPFEGLLDTLHDDIQKY